tara:strand:+ start:216 stop:737 length:522 start_codon:yes stop_codon:yes gene_type:complete
VRDGQFLGRGCSKTVVAQRRDGRIVAILRSRINPLAELAVMKSLQHHPHPHLLPLLAVESNALSGAWMVVPIARFGSMYDLVDHLEFEGLSHFYTPWHALKIHYQVSTAVSHLASLGWHHGDLRARNVLAFRFGPLPAQTHVKLGDFGEAHKGKASNGDLLALKVELLSLVAF